MIETHDPVATINGPDGEPLAEIAPVQCVIPPNCQDGRDLIASFWAQSESATMLSRFNRFWESNRQMFSFPPELGEALADTDLSGIPWDEVRLPFPSFYVGWGNYGQEEFVIQNRHYVVDGVYLLHLSGRSIAFPGDTLMLTFTARLLKPDYLAVLGAMPAGSVFREPMYEFILTGNPGETVVEALERGEARYEEHCRHSDRQLIESVRGIGDQYGLPILPEHETLRPSMMKWERAARIVRPFIPLALNCIFYLTHKPDDHAERHDLPPGLKSWIESGKSEFTRGNRESKLPDRGYSKIKFVNLPPGLTARPREAEIPSGRIISTHWRRAHWASQPYGTGSKERKWIWRPGVLVNADRGPLTHGAVRPVEAANG